MSLFSKLFRKNTHKNPDKGIGSENSGSDTESTPIHSKYNQLAELQKQRQQ